MNKLQKIKNSIKKFVTSPRFNSLAVMLLVGTVACLAQNTAGNYEAGTTALTTVSEEIAKYVPIVVKLCYAIAGVVAVVGAISVYIAMIKRVWSLIYEFGFNLINSAVICCKLSVFEYECNI